MLGINVNLSNTSSNDLMAAVGDLAWLQDTIAKNVRGAWGAAYRDVVILDPANERPVAAFNLTTYSLTIEANRNALKAILRSVAELADSDGDGLSDFWEGEMFAGDYGAGPLADSDGDSAIDLAEYAHGSRADEPASQPEFAIGMVSEGAETYLAVTFRRRLGDAGGLSYHVEFSEGLDAWASGPTHAIEVGRINPYDGTGTEIVTWRAVQPHSALSGEGFLRVRCELP